MTATPATNRAKGIRYVVAGVMVLTLIAIGVLATRKSQDSVIAPSALTGKLAPSVTAKTLNGATVSLSSYRGEVVVVNFFASWCIPCQEEHSDLKRFNDVAKGNGASLLAVLYDDSPGDARNFFTKNGGNWPVLIDNGSVAVDFGVTAPPETFVIDANGVIRQKYIGRIRYDALNTVVSQLRQEQKK